MRREQFGQQTLRDTEQQRGAANSHTQHNVCVCVCLPASLSLSLSLCLCVPLQRIAVHCIAMDDEGWAERRHNVDTNAVGTKGMKPANLEAFHTQPHLRSPLPVPSAAAVLKVDGRARRHGVFSVCGNARSFIPLQKRTNPTKYNRQVV